MKNFRAASQRFGETAESYRLYHEFLDIDIVVGVLTAVENIHHGHRHAHLRFACQGVDMLKQRLLLANRSRLTSRERHRQGCVGTQATFVLCAI